jgi:hypothetical protein
MINQVPVFTRLVCHSGAVGFHLSLILLALVQYETLVLMATMTNAASLETHTPGVDRIITPPLPSPV